MNAFDELGRRAVECLQALLRIDTSNPQSDGSPAAETPATEYVAALLRADGLEPFLDGPSPTRQSLVTRLPGTGELPPLLLHAHLDVVPADPAAWSVPPFSGAEKDGYLWGRGAIDMKHMAVMSALVIGHLARQGRRLKRDVIFAAVADEEAGCDAGSKFLVENHADKVRAEYAIGEAGGFTIYQGGRAIYPVMVAEKGTVWMTLRAKGSPGHGSMPRDDNAVVRLSEAIAKLGRCPLPHHLTPPAERYLDALADTQPFPRSLLLRQLKRPSLAPRILKLIPDKSARNAIKAILSNTAAPTMLRAGSKVNVIPGVAEAQVDGRSLPGMKSADLVAEVQAIVGNDIEILVDRDMPPVETPAPSPVWDAVRAVIDEHHPGALCVPTLMPGFTDAKQWSRLGARCYGFCPVRFPEDGPKFGDLFHGNDERIPVEGLKWGVRVLHDLVVRLAG